MSDQRNPTKSRVGVDEVVDHVNRLLLVQPFSTAATTAAAAPPRGVHTYGVEAPCAVC